VLRLLTRRRCMTCGDELPPSREYPMRVCAACILAPTQRMRATPRAQAALRWHTVPAADHNGSGDGDGDGDSGDCA
jgi:hypothetical protein